VKSKSNPSLATATSDPLAVDFGAPMPQADPNGAAAASAASAHGIQNQQPAAYSPPQPFEPYPHNVPSADD